MHELSLATRIQDIVVRAAAGREVSDVYLDVGQLRQVVPQTLTYCWGLVSEGSVAAAATLHINHIPVTVRCHECYGTHELSTPAVMCHDCNTHNVTLLSGEEFLLRSINLKEQ